MIRQRILDRLHVIFVVRWPLSLLVAVMVAMVALAAPRGTVGPDRADAIDYLAAGYHIARHGVFSEQAVAEPTAPNLGREPAYGAFLALFLAIDPSFADYDPACLTAKPRCPPAIYRHVQWAHAAFLALAGAATFLTAWLLGGGALASWVAGAHIWLNISMAKGREYIVSDPMALFLTALAGLLAVWAARRRRPVAWVAPGLALAALTLTKAVFLYLVVPATMVALLWFLARSRDRRLALMSLCLFALAYALPVGGWMARNAGLSGQPVLSAGRTAIVLNTREVFNHMTPEQYAASFVYWSRGFGDSLARRLFDERVWGPFELYRPGGFYMRGQYGIGPRVARMMVAREIDRPAAEKAVAAELRRAIVTNLPTHLAVTIPVFYRAIWIDEFIVLSLPALFWIAWWAFRRRDATVLAALAVGLFSLIFYALFSLNIPRYQMTAIPALSIALGLAAARIAAVQRRDTAPVS